MKFTIGGESHEMKMDSWQRSNVSPSIELKVERKMNDIEQKAQALVDEVRSEYPLVAGFHATSIALCRTIEQHEAFRQEVSDECIVLGFKPAPIGIGRFIIPAPKSDPLVSAMDELEWCNTDALAKDLRDTLDALGFEIREKNDG